jgi:hypothetical protein
VPNIQASQPTSITVNVRPGGTYIFTPPVGFRPRLSLANDLVARGNGKIGTLRSAI